MRPAANPPAFCARQKKTECRSRFLQLTELTLLVNIHKLIVYRGGALGTLRDRSARRSSDFSWSGFRDVSPINSGMSWA